MNHFVALQVCKYWNVLALDGSSWQKINLFDFQRDIEVRVLNLKIIVPFIATALLYITPFTFLPHCRVLWLRTYRNDAADFSNHSRSVAVNRWEISPSSECCAPQILFWYGLLQSQGFLHFQNSSESLPQHRTLRSVRVQEDHRSISDRHKQILQQIDGHQSGLVLQHNR